MISKYDYKSFNLEHKCIEEFRLNDTERLNCFSNLRHAYMA